MFHQVSNQCNQCIKLFEIKLPTFNFVMHQEEIKLLKIEISPMFVFNDPICTNINMHLENIVTSTEMSIITTILKDKISM